VYSSRDDVEIGAAEAERTDARPPWMSVALRQPGPRLGVEVQRAAAKSTRVLGLLTPMVGGSTRCFSARAVLITLARPASVLVCPIMT